LGFYPFKICHDFNVFRYRVKKKYIKSEAWLHVKISASCQNQKTDEQLFESVQVKIHVQSNLPAALLAYVVVNPTTIRSRPDSDSPDNDQLIFFISMYNFIKNCTNYLLSSVFYAHIVDIVLISITFYHIYLEPVLFISLHSWWLCQYHFSISTIYKHVYFSIIVYLELLMFLISTTAMFHFIIVLATAINLFKVKCRVNQIHTEGEITNSMMNSYYVETITV
jgi:hypothetical protein